MVRKQNLLVCSLLIAAIFSLVFIPVHAQAAVPSTSPGEATMVLMQMSEKEYAHHLKWYEKSPKVVSKDKYFMTSLDLTPYIPYDPVERDQGNASNCWVWAGTAAMELDHSRNDDVMERLSVQYFDSLYNGGKGDKWAGNGGTPEQFVAFYNAKKSAVPWSNNNAAYEDYRLICVQKEKSWSLIDNSPVSKTPFYKIEAIETFRISTANVSQKDAIKNIKSALLHGGAVIFWLQMPKVSEKDFTDFWQYKPEDAVFDLDPYNGQTVGSYDDMFSHQVLCVGYDDVTDSWLMLNSWPTTANGATFHPDNVFRVKMHANYSAMLKVSTGADCEGCDPYDYQPVMEWDYMKTVFGSKEAYYSVGDSAGYFEAGKWMIDLNKDGRLDEKNDLIVRKFGQAGDIPVPGTWVRGSGTVPAVFRNGNWFIDSNGNGKIDREADLVFTGLGDGKGDVPVVGDWNGDGLDEAGFYRNGEWFLDSNRDGKFDRRNDTYYAHFGGRRGDIPSAGRWYAGDDRDSPWIYQADGTWLIDTDMDGVYNRDTDVTLTGFGNSRQIPVPGDWRGTGSDYPTLYTRGDWQLDTEPPYGTYSDIDEEISGFGSKDSIPVAWHSLPQR